MIVKHTVSKLMYTKNMYQHKMTQECILPQTSNFSQIRVGKEEQEQEQVVRRRSTARVRTDRQTDSVLSVLLAHNGHGITVISVDVTHCRACAVRHPAYLALTR